MSCGTNTAGFNRRMLKTACPVVWEDHGAKSQIQSPDRMESTSFACIGSTKPGRPSRSDRTVFHEVCRRFVAAWVLIAKVNATTRLCIDRSIELSLIRKSVF
jgi:hypothetical protein